MREFYFPVATLVTISAAAQRMTVTPEQDMNARADFMKTSAAVTRYFSVCEWDERQAEIAETAALATFIVSREGQEIIMQNAHYLPLTAAASRAQIAKLR